MQKSDPSQAADGTGAVAQHIKLPLAIPASHIRALVQVWAAPLLIRFLANVPRNQ